MTASPAPDSHASLCRHIRRLVAGEPVPRHAALTCPECGGAVREEQADGLRLYRCHIGHRVAAEAQIEVIRRFLERDWPQPEKDEERASGTGS